MASSKPQRTECPVPAEHRRGNLPLRCTTRSHTTERVQIAFLVEMEDGRQQRKCSQCVSLKYAAAPQTGRSWSRQSIREAPLQQAGTRAARMFLSFRPTPHHNPNQNETLCYTLTARMRESRSQKSSASCDHSDGGQQDRTWTPEDCESASTFSGNSLLHGHGPNGAKE